MIGVNTLLASYGFFRGGDIGNVLAQWQAAGVFSYALPFLLIFALTFGLLTRVGLFTTKDASGEKSNKAVNAIIALAVSLMALQFDFVSLFFSEIFPRFGIALAIILVLIILGGVFFDPENQMFKWIFVIIGFVIAAIIIFK